MSLSHACDNCEGVDPGSCLMNAARFRFDPKLAEQFAARNAEVMESVNSVIAQVAVAVEAAGESLKELSRKFVDNCPQCRGTGACSGGPCPFIEEA